MPYIGNPSAQRFTSPRAASVFSGDGSTVAFTLDEAVSTDEDILVSVDGVIQEPSVAYVVSNGTTLTFQGEAPSSNSGNNIFVYYIARTFGSVSMPDGQNVNAANFSASGTGAITGNTTVGGTLGVTGETKLTDKLGIGATTIDSDIHIEKSSDLEIKLERTGSGTSTIGVPSSGQLLINNTSNADMLLSTNNTERLRIKNGGNVLVGTTNQSPAEGTGVGVRLGSNGTSQFSSSGDSGVSVNRTSDDGNVMTFRRDGTLRGRIAVDGSSTSYVTSSDYRLKENVNYNFDATSRLKQLKPARFNFIGIADNTVDGFLAHEVSSIVPEAISGEKDAMFAEVLYVDGDEIPDGKKVGDVRTAPQINPQGIDQSKLVPLLVKTLQEALTEIDTLKTKVAALESA